MKMHLHRYTFHSLRALLILAVNLLWALPTLATTLTAEQAYQKGKILHFQDRFEEAEPYLLQAGESGNAAAYYLVATSDSYNRFSMSSQEFEYRTKAAENGHLLAMLGLIGDRSKASSSQKKMWRKRFLNALGPQIEERNPFAMVLKSRLYFKEDSISMYVESLKNAAYAGYPRAQWEIARRFESGEGWFFLPGSREKEVAKLYEASARGGYHDAIWYIGATMIEKGEIDAGIRYLQPIFSSGNTSILSTYSSLITNIFPDDHPTWKYKDPLTGTAYLKAIKESMSEESNNGANKQFYEWAKELLTTEEIQQVDQLTDEYLSTHTVYKQDGLDEYEYTVDNLHTAIERWGGNAIE
ncbi:hypothetical protein LRP50_06485 [Enterovibrio sp. ZSDZ42]|uniref:Sel1 repeat family protein n=1 Tax=Enterovibrio gelatinilyticus TaxID=2899819 RepID=A0ABT5QXM1_9GAMM|nr:hypothetical protein [Enterovibrio sp. ZSDZ42]MDD1792767.1 hypothetical protein [Enterovibrio sp. ZSDZ42]